MKKTIRNSNIEIIRIISMILVISAHLSVFSGTMTYEMPLGLNKFIMGIGNMGNLGVVLFMMITGYYLVKDDNPVKPSKILKIYFQVLFYSLSIYYVLTVSRIISFTFKGLIYNIFPIISNRYWFVTAYICLYLLLPYINKLVNKLTKKEYLNLLLTFGLLVSILPFFTVDVFNLTRNNLLQVTLYYLIGGYIRLYPDNKFIEKNKYKLLIGIIIIIMLLIIGIDIISIKTTIFAKYYNYITEKTSPIIILLGYVIFYIFATKKEKNNKFINVVASTTFGSYLIHSNTYICLFVFPKLFKISSLITSKYLILYYLFDIIIIFTISGIIEYLRINSIEKLTNKLIIKIDKNKDLR